MKIYFAALLFSTTIIVSAQDKTFSTSNAKSFSLHVQNPWMAQTFSNPLGMNLRVFSENGKTATRYRATLDRSYSSFEVTPTRFDQNRSSNIDLSYGLERRYSQSRIQVYNALDFGLFREGQSSRTMINSVGVNNEWQGSSNGGLYTRAVLGAEVFLIPHLSLGTEYSYDLVYSGSKGVFNLEFGNDKVSKATGMIMLTYYFD